MCGECDSMHSKVWWENLDDADGLVVNGQRVSQERARVFDWVSRCEQCFSLGR